MSASREQASSAFTVQEHGETLVGESPSWFGAHVFGGILLAQALSAAGSTVESGEARARSLHAYFLAAAEATVPLDYDVAIVKEGRATRVRGVTVRQRQTPVLAALCSFAPDRPRPEYDISRPLELPAAAELEARRMAGPFELAFLGPTPERTNGTREHTHRAWVRIAEPLGDDLRLHEAALAFIGDLTWTGANPWELEGAPDRASMVSVDHATWFHRPARADSWLLYLVQALVHAGGRGTIRGVVYDEDRRLVCSTAQELQFR